MPLEFWRRVDPAAFAGPPAYWADDYRFDDFDEFPVRAMPSMREHPTRRFMQAGVRCPVSTGDPMVFGNCFAVAALPS